MTPESNAIQYPPRHAEFPRLGRVCRVGLATRGNTELAPEDVLRAVDAGVNYLNWCNHPDGMSAAVRAMGPRRKQVYIAAQFESRTARDAERELKSYLDELGTEYIDVLTYYYVEHAAEWKEIHAPGGAAETLERARAAGVVRSAGVTTHQRPLAAEMARSGRVDMLMVRYNAAHRGAETEVFPAARESRIPVVTYTGLRWGALLEPTPADPPEFTPPGAPEWYRFVLCHPDVTVGLMAPDGAGELEEDLELLRQWAGMSPETYAALAAHGRRVRQHAGEFP